MFANVEHRLAGKKLSLQRKRFKKLGLRSFVCPAEETEAGGTSGGVWQLAHSSLQVSPAAPPRGEDESHGHQWVATAVRCSGFDLVVVVAYLEAGVGFAGSNPERLKEIEEEVKLFKTPWLIIADWNMTPEELSETGFLAAVGGLVFLPADVSFTCGNGPGRMLDYVVAPGWVCRMLTLTADKEGPWSPHVGLRLAVDLRVARMQQWGAVKPQPFEVCSGPRQHQWHEWQVVARDHGFRQPVLDGVASSGLTARYDSFCQRAEQHLLGGSCLTEAERRRVTGRGCIRFEWQPVVAPNRPGARFSGAGACFWNAFASRLAEASKVVAKPRGRLGGDMVAWVATAVRCSASSEATAARGVQRASAAPVARVAGGCQGPWLQTAGP